MTNPARPEWVIHHIGCSDACRSVWSRASMLIKHFPCPDEDEWRSEFKGITLSFVMKPTSINIVSKNQIKLSPCRFNHVGYVNR
ncbi:hypothetical protein CEXT_360931 [Caerostris extrusa]|uniref:Uncharacterized protein n=1 Tax=Caerostris extrusa TaxID=172846 RepID=A0AAV4NW50_CAEEX|nr:hypothetical protein CEXT_360931 [Caerostris extrusa]